MENKNLFKGVLLGILIGTIGPVFSYYSSYSDVCELNAGDLEDIVEHCSKKGLYTNLITSGVLLNPDRLTKLEKLV